VTAETRRGVLTGSANPMTKRMVKLVPPIEIHGEAEFQAFCDWFCEECLRLWTADLSDPEVLDASGWRDACASA
jgi:hypothetical protein